MMRRARALGRIVALVALVMIGTAFSALPAEGQALFGVNASFPSSLYSINPTTGAATLIGPISGFSPISAVAFHPTTGVLYAVGFSEVSRVRVLLTINPATGAATEVGPTAINGNFPDMSFRSDGVLYAFHSFNGFDGIGTLDTATGAFTELDNNGIVHQGGNGIAFSPGGVLYHAGFNVGTFDQTTGALTPGANLTFPQSCPGFSRVNALAFHPGTGILFAAMNCGSNRRLGTLNIATGVITDIGASVSGLDAIAFQPIPAIEPPLTDFRDVRRPNDINVGPDLGGTTHQALNFTGTTGTAGDTWITVYDPAPNPPPVTFGSVTLSADVLIHAYNNKKGAGLLALYNEATSKKGLALTLYNAGNTDTLVLATVDQAGKLVTLKTVSLGAAITENVWYRVSMDVTVEAGLVSVIGTVFRHETPTDPDSPPTTQVGLSLTFSGTLGAGALVGVDATGEVGILAAAVNAANSSSVTNITIEP